VGKALEILLLVALAGKKKKKKPEYERKTFSLSLIAPCLQKFFWIDHQCGGDGGGGGSGGGGMMLCYR